jgi:hypothetical protein
MADLQEFTRSDVMILRADSSLLDMFLRSCLSLSVSFPLVRFIQSAGHPLSDQSASGSAWSRERSDHSELGVAQVA